MPIATNTIDREQVASLLAIQEGHFFDVKAIELSPASLTKTVSAMANASGGEIYLGVDEKLGATGVERSWRGFPDMEAANAHLQAVEAMSPLGNHYEAVFLDTPNVPGTVLHLTIFKSKDILFASNGKAYVRRGAQKLPVEGEDALRRLRLEKGIVSFEDEHVDIDSTELTNSATIIDFLLSVVPTAEPETWLDKQRLCVKGRPTVAGTLLFADEPQAALPKRSAVKVFRYKTKDKAERDYLVSDPVTVEGSTCDLIYSAVARCKETIEGIEKLGPSGLEKVEYPEEALHEVLTNAVLHRDYSIAADVQVRIYDNRVEIESPGKLAGHVTAKNILTEQFARNPKLVRIVNKFPDPPNKDVGEGLNTTFEAMEKLRLKPPIIEERDNSVVVILRHESLGSPEQLVMEYLGEHDEITNPIARELTGIKSENTMKEVFYKLRDRNLLERVADKFGNKAAWRRKSIV